MNKTIAETKQFIQDWNKLYAIKNKNVKVFFAIPYTSFQVGKFKNAYTLAQNISDNVSGAYTGQISFNQIQQFKNIKGSLIGHSECRSLLNESNEKINKKANTLLSNNLQTILCVGETKEEYEQKLTNSVVKEQIVKCLANIDETKISNLFIAYEPIWAIGTGLVATNENIETTCAYIKQVLIELYAKAGKKIPILYGGSVKSSSSNEILALNNVDGVLVGGGSLIPDEFFKISQYIPKKL